MRPFARVVRHGILAGLVACGGGSGGGEPTQVVELTAQQWSYSPNQIPVAVGSTIEFQITSHDVHHGFYMDDFGVRADAVPGMISKVRVTFDKPGTYTFHCDYFCGMGHEGMNGRVIVQ